MASLTSFIAPLTVSRSRSPSPRRSKAEVSDAAGIIVANLSMDRTSSISKSLIYIIIYLILEVGKQLLNFKLATYHDHHYPVPPSIMLMLAEVTKLVLVVTVATSTGRALFSHQPSFRFGVPALCYMATTLMYLGALRTVSPPVWMVLIQTRTLYTAVLYKVVLGRNVSNTQGLGCVLIVASIPMAKLNDLWSLQNSVLSSSIVITSQFCAFLSTVAAVSVEVLLKNDRRGFAEQQMWLYLWGVLCATLSLPATVSWEQLNDQIQVLTYNDLSLIAAAVLASSLAGLCIPVIVKHLDTIVKDYLAAGNNIMLSAATALLFPSMFHVSWLFVFSLCTLVCGIVLYERGSRHGATKLETVQTLPVVPTSTQQAAAV